MGRYIEVDSLWKCETCFHHQNGKCNTWCDCGESYRPAYNKLTIIEGELVISDDKNVFLRGAKMQKTGLLVYPVIYADAPNSFENGFRTIQLFSKGVFFTDKDEGFEYQEIMSQKTSDKYAYWSNSIIPYDVNS